MKPVREIVRLVGRALAIGALDAASVSRLTPYRFLLGFFYRERWRRLAADFDAEFYLQQIRSSSRRRRARRNPLAHYMLVGWREHRSPNLRFDPRYYFEDIERGAIRGDPFWHFLTHTSVGFPQNEIEAIRSGASLPTATISRPRRVLIFHHARGGGSSHFLALLEKDFLAQGIEPLRLRLVPLSDRLVILDQGPAGPQYFDIVDGLSQLVDVSRALEITAIVINHVVDFHKGMMATIVDLASRLGAPYWIILHDYIAVCPRLNLVDSRGQPCSVPAAETCRHCLKDGSGDIGGIDPAVWRQRWVEFARKAERVIVPSEDIQRRLQPHLRRDIEIWSPEQDNFPPRRRTTRGPPLSIAVVGNLSEAKGSAIVLALATTIRRTKASMLVTVVGDAVNRRALTRAGARVTGRYRSEDLGHMLRHIAPDIVFFSSICPETWSFVLSSALKEGLPVAAFAHGAPAHRLTALGRDDLLMPLSFIDSPDDVFAFFSAFAEGREDTFAASLQAKSNMTLCESFASKTGS